VWWKSLWCTCIHREFSYELIGEIILKISPHLPKLLSNSKGSTFLRHSVINHCLRQSKMSMFSQNPNSESLLKVSALKRCCNYKHFLKHRKSRQEAQLSQRDRTTLPVIEYFAKSLKVIRNDTVA